MITESDEVYTPADRIRIFNIDALIIQGADPADVVITLRIQSGILVSGGIPQWLYRQHHQYRNLHDTSIGTVTEACVCVCGLPRM